MFRHIIHTFPVNVHIIVRFLQPFFVLPACSSWHLRPLPKGLVFRLAELRNVMIAECHMNHLCFRIKIKRVMSAFTADAAMF
ncbi:hypothetical protein KBTX_04359 [wastewater metagenome]|uniref:Uncharacterized protein n=2 Tax=unclassified sequences TaxID=12908 RepID=A0A5B8RH77_9ZZZZ|nr:hypothetical protein KBTEX_04359 [uncultured organism]